LKSGECLRIISAHSDGIYSIQMEEDKIATGSIDKTANLFSFHRSD